MEQNLAASLSKLAAVLKSVYIQRTKGGYP
jgi:hypothetical protein